MSKMNDIFEWGKQLQDVGKLYPTFQVLDNEGVVLHEEALADIAEEDLVELMKAMVFARTLNERSVVLGKQGRLGFYAPTEGLEAAQMGSYYALDKKDFFFPMYRDIPQLIKHGLPIYKAFLWSKGHAEGNVYPDDLKAMPPQIIIGAQIIQATGAALGIKKRKKQQVAFTYIGDGGSSQGDFYEGINFAGSYKVPAVFFVQNNGYAISTPRKVQTIAPTLAQKAAAAGIVGVAVDGMDVLAVYTVTKAARAWALDGNGPVLIELLSNRFGPHSLSGDDPMRYRSAEDLQAWKAKDPLIRFRKFLEKRNLWNETIEKEYIDEVSAEIVEAIAKAEKVDKQKVSEFLMNMYEVPSKTIQEQITYYQAKEDKTNGS